MKRRDFLISTGAFSASLAFTKAGRIFASDATPEQLAHVRGHDARPCPQTFGGHTYLAARTAHH